MNHQVEEDGIGQSNRKQHQVERNFHPKQDVAQFLVGVIAKAILLDGYQPRFGQVALQRVQHKERKAEDFEGNCQKCLPGRPASE